MFPTNRINCMVIQSYIFTSTLSVNKYPNVVLETDAPMMVNLLEVHKTLLTLYEVVMQNPLVSQS